MKHVCHAVGCKVEVPPEMLMCRRHWFMVSPLWRGRVWKTYRPGQCDDMNPSLRWLAAATHAQADVACKEGKVSVAEKLRAEASEWEEKAKKEIPR
jgi:hypothetical protein